MEKITLKPLVKELVFRNNEPDTNFDVQSYQGSNNQERLLGSLFVVSHAKYPNEDLAYAVSLVSSLAKREYYSEFSLSEQNTKNAFERTLKKLNEVLDDFFKNKDLKLNIGLLAISGDSVFISRLGKFKIALARENDYIDVLNNIDLFNKDSEDEKQFSNIISGKIKTGDKIFAYFPAKSITLREKMLNPVFVKESQEDFSEKIAQLASNANNFSCCGVHITIQEIKEIPVQFMPKYSMPALSRTEKSKALPEQAEKPKIVSYIQPKITVADVDKDKPIKELMDAQPEKEIVEQPKVISAELSVTRRGTIFTPVAAQFYKLLTISHMPRRTRITFFVVIAAIILVPLMTFVIIRSGGNSGKIKMAISKATDNLKIAQSHLTQNDRLGARTSLQAALLDISGLSGKSVETMKGQLNATLDNVDNVSNNAPALFSSVLTQTKNFVPGLITAADNNPYVTDAGGIVYTVGQASADKLGQLTKTAPKFLFDSNSTLLAFNGTDTFGIYGTSKKITDFPLKNSVQAVGADLYENNLYVILADQIIKYADATTGSTKSTKWSVDPIVNPLSIAVDGNVYVLTKTGKVDTYFKGVKKGEFDSQIIPGPDSKIFASKSSAFIYLTDKTNKKVYVFDKSSGNLKTTFKLDAVGTVQDISISQKGNVWVLGNDGKVWQVQP